MKDIILVSIYNNACIPLALNFLASLKRVNLSDKHISYVTDQKTYDVITENGYKAVLISNIDIGEEKMDFASERFNLLCFKRYAVIHELLKKHEYVWHLDVDTVVLDDIINYVDKPEYNKFDIIFQNDLWLPNLCCGCMLIKSGQNTLTLTRHLSIQNITDKNDQVYLFSILVKIIDDTNNLFNIGLFPVNNFVNGEIYFKETSKFADIKYSFDNSKDTLYFVHANCMIGLDTKMKALKDKGLWFLDE